jgi:hypothetical protein
MQRAFLIMLKTLQVLLHGVLASFGDAKNVAVLEGA